MDQRTTKSNSKYVEINPRYTSSSNIIQKGKELTPILWTLHHRIHSCTHISSASLVCYYAGLSSTIPAFPTLYWHFQYQHAWYDSGKPVAVPAFWTLCRHCQSDSGKPSCLILYWHFQFNTGIPNSILACHVLYRHSQYCSCIPSTIFAFSNNALTFLTLYSHAQERQS